MESSFERGIFFDVSFVFGKGGRTDKSDVATGERGFQYVGGIESAGRIAGADEGVDLIDEEDDARRLLHFTDDFLQARFEFSAETRARDDECEVEGEDAFLREEVASGTLSYFLRQCCDEGGFADTRIAEEEGIVLLFAPEDVDESFDFMRATDEWFSRSVLPEVDGVLIEEWGFCLMSALLPCEADFWQVEHFRERRHMIVVEVRVYGIKRLLPFEGEIIEEGFDVGVIGLGEGGDEVFGADIG